MSPNVLDLGGVLCHWLGYDQDVQRPENGLFRHSFDSAFRCHGELWRIKGRRRTMPGDLLGRVALGSCELAVVSLDPV